MDTQNLLGTNLNRVEREILENLADEITKVYRSFPKDAWVLDKGNHEVSVREWLTGLSWDIKQVARVGTPSYGV